MLKKLEVFPSGKEESLAKCPVEELFTRIKHLGVYEYYRCMLDPKPGERVVQKQSLIDKIELLQNPYPIYCGVLLDCIRGLTERNVLFEVEKRLKSRGFSFVDYVKAHFILSLPVYRTLMYDKGSVEDLIQRVEPVDCQGLLIDFEKVKGLISTKKCFCKLSDYCISNRNFFFDRFKKFPVSVIDKVIDICNAVSVESMRDFFELLKHRKDAVFKVEVNKWNVSKLIEDEAKENLYLKEALEKFPDETVLFLERLVKLHRSLHVKIIYWIGKVSRENDYFYRNLKKFFLFVIRELGTLKSKYDLLYLTSTIKEVLDTALYYKDTNFFENVVVQKTVHRCWTHLYEFSNFSSLILETLEKNADVVKKSASPRNLCQLVRIGTKLTHYPKLFEVVIKALLSYPKEVTEIRVNRHGEIEIPEDLMNKLTVRQVESLVEKYVSEGGFSIFQFNKSIAESKLAVVSLTNPGKGAILLEKLKNYQPKTSVSEKDIIEWLFSTSFKSVNPIDNIPLRVPSEAIRKIGRMLKSHVQDPDLKQKVDLVFDLIHSLAKDTFLLSPDGSRKTWRKDIKQFYSTKQLFLRKGKDIVNLFVPVLTALEGKRELKWSQFGLEKTE